MGSSEGFRTVGEGAKSAVLATLLRAAAGAAGGAGSTGGLRGTAVLLLRVRLVCILLLRAGRGVEYGAGLGVLEGRELGKDEEVRTEGGVDTGTGTGSSALSAASLCSPGSG